MTNLSSNILYEDEDTLAINKPAGLVVHSDGRTIETSVAEWFVSQYPEARDVGEPLKLEGRSGEPDVFIQRPGIVHRIDRETSGVLLLAKTREGHAHLKSQFQNREVEKIYHAFVYGVLESERGVIDFQIGRKIGDFRKWSAEGDVRGQVREALTEYLVLKKMSDEKASFVEARPKTGRTHQLRVHFKALGHPIVCDRLYAPHRQTILGFERLALHARSITFTNLKNEKITIEALYPEDFKHALDMI